MKPLVKFENRNSKSCLRTGASPPKDGPVLRHGFDGFETRVPFNQRLLITVTRRAVFILGAVAAIYAAPAAETPAGQVLWFSKPAGQIDKSDATRKTAINDAFPIGNGSAGALVCGGVPEELLRLNEISLWTGGLNPKGDYNTMGAYQALGDLRIALSGSGKATDYRRALDLGHSLASVSYTSGGVAWRREYFASHPAGAIIARLTADKPGSYTGTIELDDSHSGNVSAEENRLTMSGTLSNGLQYEGQLIAKPDGGRIQANNGRLEFHGCNSLLLIFAASTDYAMDPAKNYRGEPPHAAVTARVDAAAAHSFAELMAGHEKDYASLFDRVSLDLGASTAAQGALPLDERRLRAAKETDPELERMLFQYGRYLLISCSREGGLPANLQGLWNDSNEPPWHCDYHANINVQMNYWLSEPANLAECQLPLSRWCAASSRHGAWTLATHRT